MRWFERPPSDDEIENAISAAWSVNEHGERVYKLNMCWSDARGVLASIRDHGYKVVKA